MTDFDPNTKQPVTMNVRGYVDELITGYLQHEVNPSHWMQKDGIQNCWDAIKSTNNKKKEWKCIIELHEGKVPMITITDYGTYGLTGRRMSATDLLNENPDNNERWTRFENLAFTNSRDKDKELLGSRGRGKFVFSGVSKIMTTLYDTLRDDGVYRLGKRTVEKIDAPTHIAEGQRAKDILDTYTKGILKPLNHVGSRIIIMDPKEEVVNDIKSGKLAEFVSDTWWEIITKYDANIVIKINSTSERVKSFADENYPKKTTTSDQRILEKDCIKIPSWENTRVKKIYIIYDPDKIFDQRYKGIAIQRAGMNVCRINVSDFIGPELAKHITGYVTCERDFEIEMRKSEGVEHYSYSWGTIPAKDLKQLLYNEIMSFARKELGYKDQTQQKATQTERQAKNRARKQANQIAKIIGFGKGGGGGRGKGGGGGTKVLKKIQVKLNESRFPKTNSERVDYGETIKSIGALIKNNMKNQKVTVALRIMIKSAERGETVFGKPLFAKKDIDVDKESETVFFHMKPLKIDKDNFTPGHYKIVADIALMTPFGKFKKAERIDKVEISFWVEQDPPEGGIWEDFRAISFENYEEPRNKQRATHVPGSRKNTYILEMNKEHYDYKQIDHNDEDSVAKYQYRLTIPELCIIDLDGQYRTIFTEEDIKDPARIAQVMKMTVDKFTNQEFMDKV